MKKKILLFISIMSIICLFPLKIKAANVEIKDIEIISQSDGLTEVNKPTFDGLKVNFDLGFENLNDSIKYKLTLKNNDEVDYEVNEDTKFSEDNYIKYEVSYEGKENLIKAGEEKVIFITVTYVNEVPLEEFVDGSYHEENNVIILLNTKEKNPNTYVYGGIAIAAILLVVSIVLMIVGKHKMTSLMTFAIGAMLIIPLISIATEKIEIEISSKITIEPPIKTLKLTYGGCYYGPFEPSPSKAVLAEDALDIPTFESEYVGGMNWQDFFESDYFDGTLEDIYVDYIYNHDEIVFYKNGLNECLTQYEEPEWNDDLTDDENYDIYDEYIDKLDACYDEYTIGVPVTDPILPKEEGQYDIYIGCQLG